MVRSKNEENIVKMPPADEDINPNGVGQFLYDTMSHFKDRTAQICAETGRTETYGELLKRAIRAAIKMREKGVRCGDMICLCTYNHSNSFVPSIAAQMLGAKVASMDPVLSQSDVDHLTGIARPKLMFVVPEAVELVANAVEHVGCATEIVVFFGESKKYDTFDEYVNEESPREADDFKPVATKSLRDTAYVFFSSGTTGTPKGICFSHYQCLVFLHLKSCQKLVNDVFLLYSSPYWVSATLFFLLVLHLGATRVVAKCFDAEKFWTIYKKFKIVSMFTPTSQIFDILNVKPRNADTSQIKYILMGGTSLSSEQFEQLCAEFPSTTIACGYGLTECGVLTMVDPDTPKDVLIQKAGTCGKALDGFWYKVLDPNTGDVLGPNKVGELWVKSKSVTTGYYNMDSTDLFDEDGYISTGDLVSYDDDGYFYHMDRIKELLKYRSWHVLPNALENVIATHPAVLKVTVVGLPHPIDGDHPLALVVLKHGHGHVAADEIKRYADERLHETQKLRGGLKIVAELPVTPTGKIMRRRIRELVLQNVI